MSTLPVPDLPSPAEAWRQYSAAREAVSAPVTLEPVPLQPAPGYPEGWARCFRSLGTPDDFRAAGLPTLAAMVEADTPRDALLDSLAARPRLPGSLLPRP